MTTKTKNTIKDFIRKAFERNYERLKMESTHGLSPDVKRQALQQVLLYFQKMERVALTITDTEVKLTLPEQTTPNGNKFTIEGVVDMVCELDKTTMYDLKTHDIDSINGNIEFYEKQLNVYAYIWQQLRNQQLSETAVISTQIPKEVNDAFQRKDMLEFVEALDAWNPLIPINFKQENVEKTIEEFAVMVDNIEAGNFQPASLEKISKKPRGSKTLFATSVCNNCDARYSCESYRKYLKKYKPNTAFIAYLSDLGDEASLTAATFAKIADDKPMLDAKDELGNLF